MLQNDLVHGWGLDFTLGKCVEVGLSFFCFTFPRLIYINEIYEGLVCFFTMYMHVYAAFGFLVVQFLQE